jgi:diguanylate cyclase (GGDEF)-like protein
MDLRTLTFVNLIFLFLYGGMMLASGTIYGEVRGGRWFAWSNFSRGVGLLLLTLSAILPKAPAIILGDFLMVFGMMLLHRSLAHVLRRGNPAWNIHLALTAIVFLGVAWSTLVLANYTYALMIVSVALAIQMSLTTGLMFGALQRGIRAAAWFTGAVLFACAVVYMTRAIALYRHTDGAALHVDPMLLAALLIGSMLANGGIAFAFMFLSTAQLRLELTHKAERDALTGLLNRRGLQNLADRALTRSYRAHEPLSAVMLDLDGMKAANDTWGHETGDALLCAVARLLVGSIGNLGAVARLGGDEFLVVLPGMNQGGAMEIAENLRLSIEMLNVPKCRPRASIGVASRTGSSWEEAVRQSDEALYRAKNAGKNRVMAFG